jgi:hypothetical protein
MWILLPGSRIDREWRMSDGGPHLSSVLLQIYNNEYRTYWDIVENNLHTYIAQRLSDLGSAQAMREGIEER